MARPKIEIDAEMVRKLAERQWTDKSIASFLKVSEDTLHRRFADQIDAWRAQGKGKITDWIWNLAEAGDVEMIKHAANRWLGPIPKEIKISREQAIEILEADLRQQGIAIPPASPISETIEPQEI